MAEVNKSLEELEAERAALLGEIPREAQVELGFVSETPEPEDESSLVRDVVEGEGSFQGALRGAQLLSQVPGGPQVKIPAAAVGAIAGGLLGGQAVESGIDEVGYAVDHSKSLTSNADILTSSMLLGTKRLHDALTTGNFTGLNTKDIYEAVAQHSTEGVLGNVFDMTLGYVGRGVKSAVEEFIGPQVRSWKKAIIGGKDLDGARKIDESVGLTAKDLDDPALLALAQSEAEERLGKANLLFQVLQPAIGEMAEHEKLSVAKAVFELRDELRFMDDVGTLPGLNHKVSRMLGAKSSVFNPKKLVSESRKVGGELGPLIGGQGEAFAIKEAQLIRRGEAQSLRFSDISSLMDDSANEAFDIVAKLPTESSYQLKGEYTKLREYIRADLVSPGDLSQRAELVDKITPLKKQLGELSSLKGLSENASRARQSRVTKLSKEIAELEGSIAQVEQRIANPTIDLSKLTDLQQGLARSIGSRNFEKATPLETDKAVLEEYLHSSIGNVLEQRIMGLFGDATQNPEVRSYFNNKRLYYLLNRSRKTFQKLSLSARKQSAELDGNILSREKGLWRELLHKIALVPGRTNDDLFKAHQIAQNKAGLGAGEASLSRLSSPLFTDRAPAVIGAGVKGAIDALRSGPSEAIARPARRIAGDRSAKWITENVAKVVQTIQASAQPDQAPFMLNELSSAIQGGDKSEIERTTARIAMSVPEVNNLFSPPKSGIPSEMGGRIPEDDLDGKVRVEQRILRKFKAGKITGKQKAKMQKELWEDGIVP